MQAFGSTIVGRDRELAKLSSWLSADPAVAVIGEPGIGKTSLVRAAAASAGIHLFEGGGFATLAGMPYLALRRAIGLPVAGDATAVAAIVERDVGPDVLFVDDLQWIDRATTAAVRLLRGRIGIVVAIRSGDPGTEAAMTLADQLGLVHLALPGLASDAARTVVLRHRPALGSMEVDRIVGRAGGNPLVLAEIAVHGEPSGVVRRSITAGLLGLSPEARDLVEVLAIADLPVDRERLGRAADEPLRTGILVERDGEVEVRHALIAEAIRGELRPVDLEDRHARAAMLVRGPLEVARHLALAGRLVEAASTATTALSTILDPTMRAGLLDVVARTSPPEAGLGPKLAAATALSSVSDWESVVGVLAGTEGSGTSDERAERDAMLGHALFSLGRHVEAREVLGQPNSRGFDSSSAAAAHVAIERAAFAVNVDGRLEAAIEDLRVVLASQSPGSEAHGQVRTILESMYVLATLPVDIPFLLGAIDGALAARSYASAADLARVVNFALLIWKGADAAVSFIDSLAPRFDDAGVAGTALELKAESVQACLLAGRPREAVARADDLLELPAPPRSRHTAGIFRGRALGLMGRFDEAERVSELEAIVGADFVGRGELMATQAELALWGGQPNRAIELVEAVLAIPSPIHGGHTLPQLTRSWAEFDSGRPPTTVTGILPAPTHAGAVFEVNGLRLLHEGDAAGAAIQFAEAAAGWAAFNAPRAVFCRWAEGEALRRAGDVGPMERRLASALEAAIASDHEVAAVRIRRSLRQAGVRVPAVERGLAAAGSGLTRRERELLGLAGQGLTNAEIARRMGLGRPTVARILSNAMGKLGAGSRAQAVNLGADLV
jgi:DNA-binding CsgD family transcriptional regulator